ncbi:MAG: DMT family transporter [Candidatus Omnitrophota bacterium]|nr:MAG: DMT family transporter [Candidatus Omnitrophota bacterium]
MNAPSPDPTALSTAQAQSRIRPEIVGLVCVLLAQFLFGTTFAFNKFVINQNVDPMLLGFNRMTIVTLCLLPFYRRCKGNTRWSRKDWRRVFYIGAFAQTTAIILEYVGTKYTTASNASLIISTEAIFSVFLCVLILKERLRLPSIIGGLLTIIGMLFVLLDDIRHVELHGGTGFYGDLLVLSSVVCWGLYTVGSKQVLNHSNAIYTLFFVSVFTNLSLGVVNLARGTLFQIVEISPIAWLATLFLGVFCSCLGHVLYYLALRRLPASIVALTLTLLPLFGVGVSMVVLGETLTLVQLAGAAIIIAGVGYAVWPRKDQTSIAEDAFVGT